jgi:hypothetical protein
MPRARQSSVETSNRQTHRQTPLSFEDTLKLQNEPDKALPEGVKKELATPTIYLRGIAHRRDVDDYLSAVEDLEATWSIRLPGGASIGLAGRTGERLDRASVAVAEGTSTSPYRPEWSGLSYQPRIAEPFRRGRIRTIGGRSIEPFYGIYDNPDARKVYYPQDYPWRCTGRIFTYTSWPTPSWSWWGSGVLIGPRLVLTAGHVAPWGSQSWAMLFVPAYWDQLLRVRLPRREHGRWHGSRHYPASALPTAGQPARLDWFKDLRRRLGGRELLGADRLSRSHRRCEPPRLSVWCRRARRR